MEKYIPIDSKMPDVFEILQKYEAIDDANEREYKKIIINKVKNEIKRVQRYQNLSNTIDSCILVVPEGILDLAPELVSIGKQSNVFVCSYKEVFPIAHTLQDQYIRLKEEGDIGRYKQIIKSLSQILDNINSKTESIERALTTIRNANEKIKTEVIKGNRVKEYIPEEVEMRAMSDLSKLATLRFASVLSHSDNRRVSGFGSRLCPNAFARFITMQSFSDTMSEGTSDTSQPLYDIATLKNYKLIYPNDKKEVKK